MPRFIDVISSHGVINHVLIIFCSLFQVYGNLPTKDQLLHWEATIAQHSALPEGVLVCVNILILVNKLIKQNDFNLNFPWVIKIKFEVRIFTPEFNLHHQ